MTECDLGAITDGGTILHSICYGNETEKLAGEMKKNNSEQKPIQFRSHVSFYNNKKTTRNIIIIAYNVSDNTCSNPYSALGSGDTGTMMQIVIAAAAAF